MWDLPQPGIEPMSPALAGEFFPMEPPGKPLLLFFKLIFSFSSSVFPFLNFLYMSAYLESYCGIYGIRGLACLSERCSCLYPLCRHLVTGQTGWCMWFAGKSLAPALKRGLGTEGGAVLVRLASECGPFSVVCCPQGRGLPEHCSSERPGGPDFSLASSPRDSYSSAVYHQAEGSSILLQKELKLGVRGIWLWVLVLRLSSCVTLE